MPALFDGVFALRVASMASWGRLWAGGGGRGGVLSVFASGGRMAVCPGGATACAARACVGCTERERPTGRGGAPNHTPKTPRGAASQNRLLLLLVSYGR